jgi:hypothetical protein
MASITQHLGKDSDWYTQMANKIADAFDRELWISRIGVYADYKDTMGLKRTHNAPDLASIYHPIDFDLGDAFQQYQMLRYAEHGIDRKNPNLPGGGELVWSSNWLPEFYSTRGVFPQEYIHLMLCYFKLGLTEKALRLLKATEASFGMGPSPGSLSHVQIENGSQKGSTDFSDTISIFMRSIVEGMYGIRFYLPDNHIHLKPAFPRDWAHASIQGKEYSLQFEWDGTTERYEFRTQPTATYQIRLLMRTPRIKHVRIDQTPVSYSTEAGIAHSYIQLEIPSCNKTTIEVEYESGRLPTISSIPYASSKTLYNATVEAGTIVAIHDPQSLVKVSTISNDYAMLEWQPELSGWHTLFLKVESNDYLAWLPLDLHFGEPIELEDEYFEIVDGTLCFSALFRNCTQNALNLDATVELASHSYQIQQSIPSGERGNRVHFTVTNPLQVMPGSHTIRLNYRMEEQMIHSVFSISDWDLAHKISGIREQLLDKMRYIDLSAIVNQDLKTLHCNQYEHPRPPYFSGQVTIHGRSMWELYPTGFFEVKPTIEPLWDWEFPFVTDSCIPFEIASGNHNAAFVSLFDTFPDQLSIPIQQTAQHIYFLVVTSTNPMQSRIENGVLEIHFKDGTQEILSLTNPDTIFDWLNKPYACKGTSQQIGDHAYAQVIDMDLGNPKPLSHVELRCLSNEVLLGLLGISIY